MGEVGVGRGVGWGRVRRGEIAHAQSTQFQKENFPLWSSDSHVTVDNRRSRRSHKPSCTNVST